MHKTTNLLMLWAFLLVFNTTKAQTDSTQIVEFNNMLSFNLAGTNNYYSLNYTFFLRNNFWGLIAGEIRVTYFPKDLKAIDYTVQKHFEIKSHHIVFGVGYAIYQNPINTNNSISTSPTLDIGYCYRNPAKRLSFGIFFHPMHFRPLSWNTGNQIYPYGGLTIGYNLNTPKLPWLKELTPENERELSLYAGAETSLGFGKVKMKEIGSEASSNSFSYGIFLKYYLNNIFIKGLYGQYQLNNNTLTSNGEPFEFCSRYPRYTYYGLGVGYDIYRNHGWIIAPEVEFGAYKARDNIYIKPLEDGYIMNDNLNYGLSYYSSESDKYFLKGGICFTKKILSFLDINSDLRYAKNNLLLKSGWASGLTLKNPEIQFTLGIQAHIF